MADKKISPATEADEKNAAQNNHAKDSTGGNEIQGAITNNALTTNTPAQILENLPTEILSKPRFFPVGVDKAPRLKDWSKPENQKYCGQLEGYVGFDTAGHGVDVDYLFLDFDHIFNDSGEFVNAKAAKCFNYVVDALKTYCELSASGKGAHVIGGNLRKKKYNLDAVNGSKVHFDKFFKKIHTPNLFEQKYLISS